MVFFTGEFQTSNSYPLTRLVVEICWTFEIESCHLRWQNFSLHHTNFHSISGGTNQLVNSKETSWSKEVEIEEWSLNETSTAMEDKKEIEKDIELVSVPKPIEDMSSSIGDSKHIHDCHDNDKQDCSDTSQSVVAPELKFRKLITGMIEIPEQTVQIVSILSGNVIEVDGMAKHVHDCIEQGSHSYVLVEAMEEIKWYESVKSCLP